MYEDIDFPGPPRYIASGYNARWAERQAMFEWSLNWSSDGEITMGRRLCAASAKLGYHRLFCIDVERSLYVDPGDRCGYLEEFRCELSASDKALREAIYDAPRSYLNADGSRYVPSEDSPF